MKHKAIFLDRDGVINRERNDYTWLMEDFIINEGVAEALKIFKQKNYLLIVITNQGGIAKNIYTHDQVNYLHLHLDRYLKNKGVTIDEIYYCPHHHEISKCICRKPGSLMIEKAMARFEIDPAKSFFIGDNQRDVEAALKAEVKPLLIESNSSLMNVVDLV